MGGASVATGSWTPLSQVRRPFRAAASLVGAFAALQIVFFLLLVVGQSVPDKPIIAHLAQSVDAGTYGPSGAPDRMGGVSDTFTECVVVGTGLGAREGDSAFERAIYMPRISNCEKGADDIRALAAGGESAHGIYYKYWSGYTVITRPILALAGLEALRIVSGAMLLGSLALAFSQVARRTSTFAALTLVAPLLFSTNILSTPSTSLSQAISISFILISTALVAWGAGGGWPRLVGSTVLGAALFCYVDLLTTPAIPWALASAVAASVIYRRSGNVRRAAAAGVGIAVLWALSFGLTWVSRWLIAAVFLGWNEVMSFVRTNVEFRTSGDYSGVEDGIGVSTRSNVMYWWERVPTAPVVLIGALLLMVVVLFLAVRRGGFPRLVAAVVLALPALVVPVWYEALSNHSQIHSFFTYRGVPVALGIVLFACVVSALGRRRPITARKHDVARPMEPTQKGMP